MRRIVLVISKDFKSGYTKYIHSKTFRLLLYRRTQMCYETFMFEEYGMLYYPCIIYRLRWLVGQYKTVYQFSHVHYKLISSDETFWILYVHESQVKPRNLFLNGIKPFNKRNTMKFSPNDTVNTDYGIPCSHNSDVTE